MSEVALGGYENIILKAELVGSTVGLTTKQYCAWSPVPDDE
jgi:hypothetical protein